MQQSKSRVQAGPRPELVDIGNSPLVCFTLKKFSLPRQIIDK
jgi:hypothetical protein